MELCLSELEAQLRVYNQEILAKVPPKVIF